MVKKIASFYILRTDKEEIEQLLLLEQKIVDTILNKEIVFAIHV
jgi:hypothetical protein